MKKIILSEVNRTREIMGLKPLIVEQSSLLKFFRGLLKAGDTPIAALGKTVRKEFGDLGGALIPITKLVKNSNMVEVLGEVMKNTNTIIRNNGQALSKRFKGVGIEISESQASSLGKAWTKGEDEFLIVVNRIARQTVDDISTILIKGTPSEFQKPLIDAISGVVNVKNLDEFRMVLKQIGIPEDQMTIIMNNISSSGTIGGGGILEIVFGKLIEHPNYQGDMIKLLKGSDEFQKLVRQDFKVDSLARIMGRKSNDPLVMSIYQKAIKQTWKEYVKKNALKFFDKLFMTKQGRVFLGGLIVTLGINYWLDYIYMSMGKAKAGLTPDMYIDVMGNKKFIEKYGGYTDGEALIQAELIQEALVGNFIPNTIDDEKIMKVYDDAPSILAASQICYMWENKVEGTTGTLENTLKKMSIKILPTPVTKLLGDDQIGDVKDELESKRWTTSLSVESKKDYIKQVRKNWPRYKSKLMDGNIPYYSRLSGPIDSALLAELMEDCGSQTMNDCLRKYNPLDFNSVSKTLESNKLDIYTQGEPDAVVDTDESFLDGFLDDLPEGEDKVKWLQDILKQTL
tara:strand:+ start:1822 stop:3528 length:1707 start_codon:yes stop_codon:yes gene_type:complete